MEELPKEKVRLEPIKRARGMVKDPKHVAYFMMPGTSIELTVPRTRMGSLVQVLTEEEQRLLESPKYLNLPEGTLSPYRREDNYWERTSTKVVIPERGLELDLSNPMDYIRYKIALVNKDLIAPDSSSKFDKVTYVFYVKSDKEEVSTRISKSQKLKKAYSFASKLEENESSLRNFLTVYGKRPTKEMSKSQLISEVDKLIEFDIDTFIQVAEDPLFEEKLLILDAAYYGIIDKKGNKFYLKTGEALATKGDIPTLTNAAKFIKSKDNQELLLTLTAKLEKKKG
jgi:hypothetical protein